jgi:hypothetical protein
MESGKVESDDEAEGGILVVVADAELKEETKRREKRKLNGIGMMRRMMKMM